VALFSRILRSKATITAEAPKTPTNTSAPRIKVQVKRRANRVNVGYLRSFIAVLGEQDVGIFVSLGGFSGDAEDEARTRETRKLTLVDLEKLVDLWVEHYEKIAESDKRLLPLKPVYYLTQSE
jgi:restriction system protein